MAIAVTAASVVPTNPLSAKKAVVAAGVTITQGQVVAFDASGKLVLADADSTTELTRIPIGIAVTGASPGQPCLYVNRDDTFTAGATLTAGAPVFLSTTAGGLDYITSQATEYPALIGYAIDTTRMKLAISFSPTQATDPTP